jgi:hypothetical protein
MNIKTRMKVILSSIFTSVLSIDMDEYQNMDGIIFYHPYGRQCYPLTVMNIKTQMKVYLIIHTDVSLQPRIFP